jgi:nitrogen regulatory protein P-II 1
MTKVECIIRPERLEAVKEALSKLGSSGMTVSQVMGCGMQRGWKEVYRGVETSINLLPKIKVEVLVKDDLADSVVEQVCQAARTGEIGDGKIFVYPVSNAVRIRTGESGEDAI